MEKSKSVIALLAIAFAAGGFLVWFLIRIGAKPKTVNVGPIEFEVPDETITATSVMITDMPASTTTPVPTTRPLTSIPYAGRWIQEVSQVPENGTQLTWSLSAGQVMFLVGG